MNEFNYERVDRDSWGRLYYVCKCRVCGKECFYRRKVKSAPVCIECSKAAEKEKAKDRRRESYEKGYADGATAERQRIMQIIEHILAGGENGK